MTPATNSQRILPLIHTYNILEKKITERRREHSKAKGK